MHKYTLTRDSFVINGTKRDIVSFKDPGDVGTTFDIIRCGEVIYKDLDLFDNCWEARGRIFIWSERENLDIRDGDEIHIISSTEKYFIETSKYRLSSSN